MCHAPMHGCGPAISGRAAFREYLQSMTHASMTHTRPFEQLSPKLEMKVSFALLNYRLLTFVVLSHGLLSFALQSFALLWSGSLTFVLLRSVLLRLASLVFIFIIFA